MKRIILCTDGTWNKPDQKDRGKRKPSNVVKMARAIKPRADDGTEQIVYYGDGVGTNWGLDKIAGGGFGVGLSANIVDAYQFLALNYEEGDEIFLFGFSRGAYTARSIAGLVHKLGILPKDHAFFIPEAYKLYRDQARDIELESFRLDHNSRPARIKYIGVWDTVGALGIPIGLFKTFNKRYQFHEVDLVSSIENAYHALAIDERRKPFAPTLWHLPHGSEQTLEQVWFPGVHTNIGGGYSKDGLANISLQWIAGKAESHGLELDRTFLNYYRPWYKHEMRESLTLFYKIIGPRWRPMGQGSSTKQYIHSSALKRIEAFDDYRPDNLMEQLDQMPVYEET